MLLLEIHTEYLVGPLGTSTVAASLGFHAKAASCATGSREGYPSISKLMSQCKNMLVFPKEIHLPFLLTNDGLCSFNDQEHKGNITMCPNTLLSLARQIQQAKQTNEGVWDFSGRLKASSTLETKKIWGA